MKQLLITVLCTLLAVSCKKESSGNDSLQESLLGGWEYANATFQVETSDPALTEYLQQGFMNKKECVYDQDDQRQRLFITREGYAYSDISTPGRWRWMPYVLKGDRLRLYFDGGTEYDESRISIEGTILTIIYDETAQCQAEYPEVQVKRVVETVQFAKKEGFIPSFSTL